MNKEIEIPEGHEARIDGNKVIIEPKENNDEKIRKSLVEYFRRFNPKDMWDEVFSIGDVLSYLEKQKEQIVIKQNIIDSIRANTQPDWDFSTIPNLREEINRFFGKKFVLPHTEDTIITVSDVIRCAYHFYKFGQQEQKPAEKLSKEEYVKKFKALCGAYEIKLPNREYDIYGLCEDLHKLFGDIQKPAEWSLTDATFIEEIDETLFMAETGRNEVVKNQIERERNWLNSIPERFNLQPKQEWSEEDEKRLKSIIHRIEVQFACNIFGEGKLDVDWLKSLPERFNLQPKQEWSEEEMKVLDSIIDDYEKANKSFCGYAGKIAFLKAIRDGEYDLPKQEWSEEDERKYKVVLELIDSWANGTIGGCIIPTNTDRYINWFKTLPERFNLQLKQEWSEEDNEKVERLRSIVNDCAFRNDALDVNGDYCEGDYEELDDWLKSLRPQPHWKPSEEKMVALDAAISYLEESDNEDYEILNSLYEDLKKL